MRALFDLSPDCVHAALFLLSSHARPVRDAVAKYRKQLDGNPMDAVDRGAFGPPEGNLTLRAVESQRWRG